MDISYETENKIIDSRIKFLNHCIWILENTKIICNKNLTWIDALINI